MNIHISIFRQKNLVLFAVLVGISALCTFIISQYVMTNELYYRSMGEQLTLEQIDQLRAIQDRYAWLSYVLIAMINLIKYTLIAGVLYTGIFLSGFKVDFGRVFKLVLVAEFVLLLPMISKMLWFAFFDNGYSLDDLQFFYPLSLLSVVDPNQVDALWHYPLQVLNVFELLYWIVLGWGLHLLIQRNFDLSLRIVLGSYLPALLLWIVWVMFLTVTFNPRA